jgi:hypothetical protein
MGQHATLNEKKQNERNSSHHIPCLKGSKKIWLIFQNPQFDPTNGIHALLLFLQVLSSAPNDDDSSGKMRKITLLL